MEPIKIAIEALTLFTLIFSAIFYYKQLVVLSKQLREVKDQTAKTHEWNRRKSAQELLDKMLGSNYHIMVNEIESITNVNLTNQKQTYDDIINDSSNINDEVKKTLQDRLRYILNFSEAVALGVKHQIYDKDIAYDYFGFNIPNIYRWAEPYIDFIRNESRDQTIYMEMEILAKEWQIRNEKENEKAKTSLRTKGKEPL